MTKKEMKLSLKKAVMDASPDVLDQILSPSPQRMASVMEFKEERKTVNTANACGQPPALFRSFLFFV